jgi:hypothetical protein
MIRVSRIPGSRIDFVRIIALDASTVHEVVAGRAKRPKICRVKCSGRIGFDWHFMMHGARLNDRAVALVAFFAKRFCRELALSGAVPCAAIVQASGHSVHRLGFVVRVKKIRQIREHFCGPNAVRVVGVDHQGRERVDQCAAGPPPIAARELACVL